jgi:tripartite-type tricarboxylate transporter receptor subunit TctC
MDIWRKTLSFVAFMLMITSAVCAADADKAWPTRHVRVIVPFAAGSVNDVAARLYADGLTKRWGQPVVIENRPGAETNIGTAAFTSAHDDHTLLYGVSSTLTVNPLVFGTMPFDPARDLVPISAGANAILLVAVHIGVPAHSLTDLARIAQGEPGKLLWGSGPVLPRYVFNAFLKRRSLDMLYVPYRDVATPQVDLGEGRLQVLVTSVSASNAPVQSGKARIIAVTNAQRAPILPDVPTAAEAGYPEMTIDGLSGFFGWRDMPVALRDKISADVQAVAQDPEVRARMEPSGLLVLGTTPAEFAAAIDGQRVRVGEIARLIDLKALSSK